MSQRSAKLVLGAVIALGMTGAASAQTGAAAVQSPPVVLPPPTMRAPQAPKSINRIMDEAFLYHLTRETAYVHTPQTDRADRVSRLIDAGRCAEARALADKEGDVLMAEKVPAICRMKEQGLLGR